MSDFDSTPHYEHRDLNIRAIAWFMMGLVLALVAIIICVHLFRSALEGSRPQTAQGFHNPAPSPRLETGASVEIAASRRAGEKAALNHYRWVDRKAGILEIPIERAMELTAQRGLPARASASQGGGP